jgi:hypothetical protein
MVLAGAVSIVCISSAFSLFHTKFKASAQFSWICLHITASQFYCDTDEEFSSHLCFVAVGQAPYGIIAGQSKRAA